MEYTVTYLSCEGRVVTTTIEAESAEDAEAKAWEADAEFKSGDNIDEILSVE